MPQMTAEERRAFLTEGTRTAAVGVTRRDGGPWVLPVWFVLDGDDVIFTTGAGTARGRALRRDGRVSLCVDEATPPYAFVRVDGRASLSEDLAEMRAWALRISARYMGEELAERYAERNAVPGELLVRVIPRHDRRPRRGLRLSPPRDGGAASDAAPRRGYRAAASVRLPTRCSTNQSRAALPTPSSSRRPAPPARSDWTTA